MADSLAKRQARYYQVLEPIRERDRFTSKEIVSACRELSAVFVDRVLKQMTDDGWLVSSFDGSTTNYSWAQSRSEFASEIWLKKRFGSTVLAAPEQERPRERLLRLGAEALKTSELLAILIRVGRPGESAVAAGEKLAGAFADDLAKLKNHSQAELRKISPVVSVGVYCQIMAAIELGRRVAEAIEQRPDSNLRLDNVPAAVDYCRRKFRRLALDAVREEFHIVTLNTKLIPIATHLITVGTLDASLVHPREIFTKAIRDSAAAIILVHNHPSGDPTPSREDLAVTRRLRQAAEIIGIRIVDHIVVASSNCVSITEWEGN